MYKEKQIHNLFFSCCFSSSTSSVFQRRSLDIRYSSSVSASSSLFHQENRRKEKKRKERTSQTKKNMSRSCLSMTKVCVVCFNLLKKKEKKINSSNRASV
jgi:hypothetical protein